MRKQSVALISSVALMCASQLACSKKSSDSSSSAVKNLKVESMILDLPSSISASSSQQLSAKLAKSKLVTASSGSGQGVDGIYNGIRMTIGMVEMFSGLVKEVADLAFKEGNAFGVDLTAITTDSPFVWTGTTDEGGPAGLKIVKNATGSSFDYTASFYWKNASDQYVPGVQFSFTATSDSTGKGEVYLSRSAMEDGASGVFLIKFDTSDATLGQTMSIEFSGGVDSSSSSGPSNGKVVASSKNGILTVTGNLYISQFGGDSNPLFSSAARNYLFVGQADTAADKAVMSVALPPSTSTDSTAQVFTDYSIASIFQDGLVYFLGGLNETSGGCCCTLGSMLGLSEANMCTSATTCANSSGSCGARTQSGATIISELGTFCAANSSSEICSSVGYVYNMSNPAYFDTNGFVGTETYNKPSSGYSNLSVSGLTVDSAATVAALSVTFDATPVTSLK